MSPTKINRRSLDNSDSNDSNDSNLEDLFEKVFSSNESSYQTENLNDMQHNNKNKKLVGEIKDDTLIENKKEIFRRYYNCDVQFNTREAYLKHCVNIHPHRTAFPSKTEIEKYNLKPQGKPWERQ